MAFDQVARALKDGADPAMLCMTCPWDRNCIVPPAMTSEDVNRKIDEAAQRDEERLNAAKAKGEPVGIPVGMLLTTMTFAGRDKSAEICPVLAMRLRLPEGRATVDLIKSHMQGAA